MFSTITKICHITGILKIVLWSIFSKCVSVPENKSVKRESREFTVGLLGLFLPNMFSHGSPYCDSCLNIRHISHKCRSNREHLYVHLYSSHP